MTKEDILEQVKPTLLKHKINQDVKVTIDNRKSKSEIKAKVDLHIGFAAYGFLGKKSKLADLLKDVKAIDDTLIVKTQICKLGESRYVIRLYLAKEPSKVKKFVCRKLISAKGLQTRNDVLMSVKKGMRIHYIENAPSMTGLVILSISKKFVKLTTKIGEKVSNIPVTFFHNKTVLIN